MWYKWETGLCRILVVRLEGMRLLGRPWCRWEDIIKIIWLRIRIGGREFLE